MRAMDILKRFFPTGTTEGDKLILPEVFIMPDQMAEIISAPPGSPRLMVGNKGAGKTAIIDHLHRVSTGEKIPALSMQPDDLDLSAVSNASDIGTLKRRMYQCLLEAIAIHIGKNASGLLNSGDARLHKLAVEKGEKSEDIVERALKVLPSLAKSVADIDVETLVQRLAGAGAKAPIRNAVEHHLLRTDAVLFLLFDDTDQIASPDDPSHLNRIWAFLLAVRRLSQEVPRLRAIISLRSDVWLRLTRDERGQRDQVDHFRPLVVDLRPTIAYLRQILERRIEAADRAMGTAARRSWWGKGAEKSPWSTFFENQDVRIAGSAESRPWPGFLTKWARERPRDMIQLVGKLADSTKRVGREKITSADAESAMHSYSAERTKDLAIEFVGDCPQLEELIRTFGGMNHRLTFEELRRHLQTVPSRFSLQIRGVSLNSGNDDSFLKMLGLLFEAGFVNARVADNRQPGGFRHVVYADDSHLIQKSRWNDLQAANWEIHPAFRTLIADIGQDLSSRR